MSWWLTWVVSKVLLSRWHDDNVRFKQRYVNTISFFTGVLDLLTRLLDNMLPCARYLAFNDKKVAKIFPRIFQSTKFLSQSLEAACSIFVLIPTKARTWCQQNKFCAIAGLGGVNSFTFGRGWLILHAGIYLMLLTFIKFLLNKQKSIQPSAQAFVEGDHLVTPTHQPQLTAISTFYADTLQSKWPVSMPPFSSLPSSWMNHLHSPSQWCHCWPASGPLVTTTLTKPAKMLRLHRQ